ncbi:MAG: ribosome maturation factor RimM, partial [Candidatus Acidiferrales bacterium]
SRVVPAGSFEGVTLARIVRPHGLRGEVAADILTDFPERLPALKRVWLSDGRTPPRPVASLSCRLHNRQAIFLLEGFHSIDDAEKLRGLEIQVPLAERVKLGAGQYFVTDLIGCEVIEAGATVPLGRVRDVPKAGTPLLAVDTAEGELLIPFAAVFCTAIDLAARRIVVSLPEGLRESQSK